MTSANTDPRTGRETRQDKCTRCGGLWPLAQVDVGVCASCGDPFDGYCCHQECPSVFGYEDEPSDRIVADTEAVNRGWLRLQKTKTEELARKREAKKRTEAAQAETPFETWLPVVGFEGLYEVSDLGRVRSLDRETRNGFGSYVRPGRLLKTPIGGTGYRQVSLTDAGGRMASYKVHRLVALAFHGPSPEGKPFALHGDGDQLNNLSVHLRWGSQAENQQDSIKHGTHHRLNRTECPRGHALDSPNLVLSQVRKGKRACLACARGKNNVHRAAERDITLDLKTEADRHYAEILGAVSL